MAIETPWFISQQKGSFHEFCDPNLRIAYERGYQLTTTDNAKFNREETA